MINTQTEEEIITKESIDKEMLEKAMVDEKILSVLDNIQLILIIVLVGVMIYITFTKVKEYVMKKRKEQQDLHDQQQRDLMRNYKEKDENEA